MAQFKHQFSPQAFIGSGIATFCIMAFSFGWFVVVGNVASGSSQKPVEEREFTTRSSAFDERDEIAQADGNKKKKNNSNNSQDSNTDGNGNDVIVAPDGTVIDSGTTDQPISDTVSTPQPGSGGSSGGGGDGTPDDGNPFPPPPTFVHCSGQVPDIPDGVCLAVNSIEGNPTAENPHLGGQVADMMSLMPDGTTVTLIESSWTSTGSASGDIVIVATVPSLGDIPVDVGVEKQGDIWVLMTVIVPET